MTTLDHPTHAIGAETRTVVTVARLTEVVRMFFRLLKNRRQVGQLTRLSDHALADIGLMRTDLEVALSAPFGSDPSVKLSDFARERRLIESGARSVC